MINLEVYRKILNSLEPYNASLVAVSKFKSKDDILELYHEGHRDFGENYVQELVQKQEELPKDIRWHFIGSLQRNKVKYIAPFIHLIHGVDSFRLYKEINKEGAKNNRVIPCLLQMHIAEEDTKSGLDERDMIEFFEYCEAQASELKNVRLKGVMGMATFTENQEKVVSEFQQLKNHFHFIKDSYFIGDKEFKTISMGMSNDYELALEHGSNMVRIGSLIFGNR